MTQFMRYRQGKQTLKELSEQTHKSISTLQRELDKLAITPQWPPVPDEPINLPKTP